MQPVIKNRDLLPGPTLMLYTTIVRHMAGKRVAAAAWIVILGIGLLSGSAQATVLGSYACHCDTCFFGSSYNDIHLLQSCSEAVCLQSIPTSCIMSCAGFCSGPGTVLSATCNSGSDTCGGGGGGGTGSGGTLSGTPFQNLGGDGITSGAGGLNNDFGTTRLAGPEQGQASFTSHATRANKQWMEEAMRRQTAIAPMRDTPAPKTTIDFERRYLKDSADSTCDQDWNSCERAAEQGQRFEQREGNYVAGELGSAGAVVLTQSIVDALPVSRSKEFMEAFGKDVLGKNMAKNAVEAPGKGEKYYKLAGKAKKCINEYRKSTASTLDAGKINRAIAVHDKCMSPAADEAKGALEKILGKVAPLSKKFYDAAKSFLPRYAAGLTSRAESYMTSAANCAGTKCR